MTEICLTDAKITETKALAPRETRIAECPQALPSALSMSRFVIARVRGACSEGLLNVDGLLDSPAVVLIHVAPAQPQPFLSKSDTTMSSMTRGAGIPFSAPRFVLEALQQVFHGIGICCFELCFKLGDFLQPASVCVATVTILSSLEEESHGNATTKHVHFFMRGRACVLIVGRTL